MPACTPRLPGRGLVSLACSACLLLGGCTALGPDFKRPAVPWLADWSGGAQRALPAADAQARAQPPAAVDAWWTNFGDPVLEQVVTQAQRQNPGVRIAAMRILESRALLGIAGSGLYPQVQEVSASAPRTGQRQSRGADTAFWSAGAGFDIAWEMDFWGKYRRGIESADAGYFASIAQYDDAQVLVAAQAASLYGSIRTTELRLRIAHENAAIQKRSLEITERLFKSGNESELDVQQARSQYLGTLAVIPELESALRQTQNALGVLLARPPGPLPEMEAGKGVIPQASLALIVDMPADLLRRRPDVRTAEMLLAAQSAQIGVSEAALYPSIALGGTVGLSATSLASSPTTLSWGVGPALVWNVFDHGRLSNQVLVQDARFQQLNEQYQDTVLRAAREMDDSATAFASSRTQVDILQEAVRAARRSLEIANVQYREGLIDFERVLDSQRTLFSQQDRLASTQGSVVQSLVALYKAMGGGWQAGRERPLLDEGTRRAMAERSHWKTLLDEPLPPPDVQPQPAQRSNDKP
ncbi:efflux transporter outer membrane subunit [Variovorax soli]|uniref:efflux transporter outer membrane subunit n=2 Tax=Variovorax soli TaxID=376815 RepID=UPI00361CA872